MLYYYQTSFKPFSRFLELRGMNDAAEVVVIKSLLFNSEFRIVHFLSLFTHFSWQYQFEILRFLSELRLVSKNSTWIESRKVSPETWLYLLKPRFFLETEAASYWTYIQPEKHF